MGGARHRFRPTFHEPEIAHDSPPPYSRPHVISEIRIRNFKSIDDLTLKPGRVTVLIGENGSGKSNILEAIAFAAAASADKLDNEFLFNRGIRVTDYPWMQSAFPKAENSSEETATYLEFRDSDRSLDLSYEVFPDLSPNGTSRGWRITVPTQPSPWIQSVLDSLNLQKALSDLDKRARFIRAIEQETASGIHLPKFLIYAPENTVLRSPPPEGAIMPLGPKGEGLFRLLQTFASPESAPQLTDLKERLRLLGWFEDFLPPDELATFQARLQIRDKWLAPERAIFDQRSANEGFLYLLFYFTLLISNRTPRFFAIDNVDNALNPKLCTALMRQIAELAAKYDKQVICTTHNPAILDGLNLHDDAQRLFTVSRDEDGRTVINRVKPPIPQPGKPPMKLSAAFLAGHLGGLPDHF